MDNKRRFYPEVRFGGFTDIDGTVAFYNRIHALLDPAMVVLDVGCGRGAFDEDDVPLRRDLRILKGKVSRVVGIDVDPDASDNPFLDDFRLIEGATWPVESDSIDLIVCDYVLEHIPDPGQLFGEVRRVLKDGGYLCIRTSNRWSYIAIAARLIPNRYHSKVTSTVQEDRKEEDVFPTVYRCNTRGKLRKLMTSVGFECVVYGYESEPSYLAFSTIAYFFGVIHQRLAPAFIRPSLVAFGKITKSAD
ncbi:MAG: class I SAM-dependent methyltransferase [Acidobacteriota bacterium]|nr:class I SAM-dependent methyltransferase [Acidobacteriota bacterium]MDH3784409.1 class I SAM-dependent methyltransferase [Acidobacteriota bacterium]